MNGTPAAFRTEIEQVATALLRSTAPEHKPWISSPAHFQEGLGMVLDDVLIPCDTGGYFIHEDGPDSPTYHVTATTCRRCGSKKSRGLCACCCGAKIYDEWQAQRTRQASDDDGWEDEGTADSFAPDDGATEPSVQEGPLYGPGATHPPPTYPQASQESNVDQTPPWPLTQEDVEQWRGASQQMADHYRQLMAAVAEVQATQDLLFAQQKQRIVALSRELGTAATTQEEYAVFVKEHTRLPLDAKHYLTIIARLEALAQRETLHAVQSQTPAPDAAKVGVSAKVYIQVDGRVEERLLYDVTEAALEARLDALYAKWPPASYGTPVSQSQPGPTPALGSTPPEGWCVVHNMQMKWRPPKPGDAKPGWWSHQIDGAWCRGKAS